MGSTIWEALYNSHLQNLYLWEAQFGKRNVGSTIWEALTFRPPHFPWFAACVDMSPKLCGNGSPECQIKSEHKKTKSHIHVTLWCQKWIGWDGYLWVG